MGGYPLSHPTSASKDERNMRFCRRGELAAFGDRSMKPNSPTILPHWIR
jgi:hypothetical protein